MAAVAEKIKVPELRFPSFAGGWEEKRLGEIGNTRSGLTYSPTDVVDDASGIMVARSSNIQEGLACFEDCVFVDMDIPHSSILRKGDILICVRNGSRKLIGKKLLVCDRLMDKAFGAFMSVFESEYNDFVNHLLDSSTFKKQIQQNLGATINQITTKNLLEFQFWFPSDREQGKIAEFLTAVDEKIAKLKRKKELLEEYKKGVMQKLFSQEIRFKDDDGNDFPDWENRRMGDFLSEHGEKSKGNEPVFSVSVHKGLVDQIEHLGRSFAASDTSHYNRINPDDVVYTKSPTGDFPYGIVKRNQSGVAAIVSPLYGVFEPESKGLGIWLNEYFASTANTHNYLHSIIQKGAKNTINITNRTFLSKELKVPSDFEEQTKIGQCFSEMNHRIDSLAEQINKAQEFKRGLLQKMFV